MILIFGYNLIYWTGILTGILFLLSFFGCCCHLGKKIYKMKAVKFLAKHHKLIIYSALISMLAHVSLAILARAGIII